MRSRLLAFLIFAIAAPSTCWGQHARIPVRIETGWETTFYPIGEVDAGSELATTGAKGAVVSFAVDRLWFVVPFWNGRAEYVLSDPYEPGEKPKEVFAFLNQSASNVSKLSDIPLRRLGRPWSSYIPIGWPIVISIVALVNIFSGPSPLKKFQKIWAEPRYRAALALMFGCDDLASREFPFQVFLREIPPDPEEALREILPALEEDGLPRRKTERDLEFGFRYLAENGHIVIIEPGENAADGGQQGDPPVGDAAPPDPTWKPDGPVG